VACHGVASWRQQTPFLQCTMTKVGKSDGDGTFAGAFDNDEDAPLAATDFLARASAA